jgi:hypothetical protein
MLYGARSDGTCLSEIGIESGEYFQFIRIRPNPDAQVQALVLGAFEYYHQSGGLSLLGDWAMKQDIPRGHHIPGRLSEVLLIDAFFAEQFAKTASRSCDYKLTSWIAEALSAKFRTKALLYPSVQHRGGMNIAIEADIYDSSFTIVGGSYGVVEEYYGYGVHLLHEMEVVKEGKDGSFEFTFQPRRRPATV